MPKITANQFRSPLVNKRDTYFEYGANGVLPERLRPINGATEQTPKFYAILNECIWESDAANFIAVKYGDDINNLTTLSSDYYDVNLDTAVITFADNYPATAVPHYAFYKAGGSIIWVEDVNSLQKACIDIDNSAVYKNIKTVMEANLDFNGNNIERVNSIEATYVDGLMLRNHSHTGGAYDAPNITVDGLADNAVETSKIKDSAVTETKIQDGAVVTDKIYDGAVTTNKLGDSSVINSKIANNTIESTKLKDGTLKYTKLDTTNILTNIFDVLYPVGSIYITTASTCPIANYVGTWTLKSGGRVLQGADGSHEAGSTVDSALPNHYHGFGYNTNNNNGTFLSSYVSSGRPPTTSVTTKNSGGSIQWNGSGGDSGKTSYNHASYNANMFTSLVRQEANTSTGGGVYQDSSVVQPPAYIVNIFERTA